MPQPPSLLTRPWRALLLPWWTLSLATGAKSFVDNPLLGSRRLNAAGLHVARLRLAHALAARRRARLAHLIDADARAAFDRDGFVAMPDFLPAETFAALRDGLRCWRGPAREMVQGNAVTRRLALDPALLRAVPALRTLLADARWRGLIRYAASFDAEPVSYVQTILSHRGDGPDDPQLALHSDAFQPSAKAWLFLDRVEDADGAFTYVPGSHRLTGERLAWERARSLTAARAERLTARGSFRIDPAELPALGLPPPKAFAVPANTLVVADTFGFHARGRAAAPGERVEIWAYSRRSPFVPWGGPDIGGLPGLAERRVIAYWHARDRLARWIGQPWRDVGPRNPWDA